MDIINMPKETYCNKPFDEMNIDVDGTMSPCCVIGGKKYLSIKEYLSSSYLLNIQRDLQQGIKNKACEDCWRNEKAGSLSNRTYKSPQNFIREIHLKFSNKCNLKCIMCSCKLSSAIGIEEKSTIGITKSLSNKKLKKEFYSNILPTLEHISMSGGEPFLSDDHLELLQIAYLINPKVQLSYNTNMTITAYKGYDIIELWKNYNNVSIVSSIDGIEKVQEYQRYGSKWSTIKTNIVHYKDYIDQIHCTITIYNIFGIPELIKWAIKNDFGTKLKFFYVAQMYVSPISLDKQYKTMIINKFRTIFPQLSKNFQLQIINEIFKPMLNNNCINEELNRQFKIHTTNKDLLRNNSFTDTVPELKEWYEEIKT
jgi:MoaA/NifB/PqqE/SkfB family radical SAM enzyme